MGCSLSMKKPWFLYSYMWMQGLSEKEAYHLHFPAHMLQQQLSICHLEVLNAMVVVKLWAPKLASQLVHLFCDNTTAVAIFQAGKGRDPFLHACTREMWLTSAIWDITLTIGHMARESLAASTDALSHWYLGQVYREKSLCYG